jgi:hypothetical protein
MDGARGEESVRRGEDRGRAPTRVPAEGGERPTLAADGSMHLVTNDGDVRNAGRRQCRASDMTYSRVRQAPIGQSHKFRSWAMSSRDRGMRAIGR